MKYITIIYFAAMLTGCAGLNFSFVATLSHNATAQTTAILDHDKKP